MTNSVQFLTADLLNEQQKVNEIDHWLKVMNRPQGWHYDLDIIWILSELEKAGIKKGATILDAGAGMGVTQYVLAAQGYNVISLDFSHRVLPTLVEGIFDMKIASQETLSYKHDYMGFVDYGTGSDGASKKESFFSKLFRLFKRDPLFLITYFKNQAIKKKNKDYNEQERSKDHSQFGTIRLVRAAFHEMPIADMSVDALISVSAIEHADKALMDQNIAEMKRVVKPGGLLLITTSAANSKEDTFHDRTKGLCFSRASLAHMAGIEQLPSFEYDKAEKNILSSKKWFSRIDPYYRLDPTSEFSKKQIKSLPYLPVGIKIIK